MKGLLKNGTILGMMFMFFLIAPVAYAEDASREPSSTEGISARLKIEREKRSKRGRGVIFVTGRITNNTDSRKMVRIEIYLKDFSGNIVKSNLEIPSPSVLDPDKEATFSSKFYVMDLQDAWKVSYTVYGY